MEPEILLLVKYSSVHRDRSIAPYSLDQTISHAKGIMPGSKYRNLH